MKQKKRQTGGENPQRVCLFFCFYLVYKSLLADCLKILTADCLERVGTADFAFVADYYWILWANYP